MKKSISLKRLGLLLIFVLFNGCATVGDVVESKDERVVRLYPVNSNQAWEIAKTVLNWEGADAIDRHRSEGYMLASTGMTAFSWGVVMGVWIESVDKDNSKVAVVVKRKLAINVITTLTETTFHKHFAQAVEIVKRGEKLPLKPPR